MLTVIGEAIIDLVQDADGRYTAHAGGSDLNVAIGLARLGHPTRIGARFSRSRLGRHLREHAVDNGVEVSHAVDADEPASLAVVAVAPDGSAAYDFYLDGAADWQWSGAELAPLIAAATVLHTGSLACFRQPAADQIAAAAANASRRGAMVSFDPNVRPGLLGPAEVARQRVEILVGCAHVVKASDQDLAWLYPGWAIEAVVERWRSLGPRLVCVTLGANGALAAVRHDLVHRPAAPAVVVDTVGAGDAFTAGLLSGLIRAGAATPATVGALGDDDLATIVDQAIVAAAISCSRAGPNPPTWSELAACLDAMGPASRWP